MINYKNSQRTVQPTLTLNNHPIAAVLELMTSTSFPLSLTGRLPRYSLQLTHSFAILLLLQDGNMSLSPHQAVQRKDFL